MRAQAEWRRTVASLSCVFGGLCVVSSLVRMLSLFWRGAFAPGTRPLVGLLVGGTLVLFGWWLGNPRRRASPRD